MPIPKSCLGQQKIGLPSFKSSAIHFYNVIFVPLLQLKLLHKTCNHFINPLRYVNEVVNFLAVKIRL